MRAWCCIPIVLVAVCWACGRSDRDIADQIEFGPGGAPVTRVSRPAPGPMADPLEEMPGDSIVPLRGRPIGRLPEVFNDSNAVHLAEAERLGIEPLTTTRSHWQLRRPLVRIASCADFYVEELTYSHPYLVPEAAAMLHEAGRRFNDTLRSRGGGDYRIRVTSVLRTPEAVRRLRRVNRNAMDSSVHRFGTTVDISYANFAADSRRIQRRAEDLKGILAEVLLAMRREGKIYVKYERQQPCFHITCRQGMKK